MYIGLSRENIKRCEKTPSRFKNKTNNALKLLGRNGNH